ADGARRRRDAMILRASAHRLRTWVRSSASARALRRSVVLAASATSLAAAACSGVKQEETGIDAPSESEQQFGPVADFLEHRCGALDWHGHVRRTPRSSPRHAIRLDAGDLQWLPL